MASLTRTFGITAIIAGFLLFFSLREPVIGAATFVIGLLVLGSTMRQSKSRVSQAKAKLKSSPAHDELDLNDLDDASPADLASQQEKGRNNVFSKKPLDKVMFGSGKESTFNAYKNQDDLKKQWWLFNRNQQMQKQSQDMLKGQMDMARKQQEEWRRQQEMRRRRQ